MDEQTVVTNLAAAGVSTAEKTARVQEFIMHHVRDGHEWMPFPKVHVLLPDWLTLGSAMIVFSAVVLLLVAAAAGRRRDPVPRGLANVVELFVLFIRDQISVPYLGEEDGRRMTPLFCTYFFFILTMNLLGLVPCFAAATANVSVTGALASITLLLMIFGGMYRTGFVGFFKAFAPHGVPWPVLIMLVPLEILGLFIKAFALTVRLFANILAGHIVIFSLLGLILIFGYAALPSMLMAIGIYVLEVLVAVLQAYIFTLLSAIFIGQRFHPAH